MSSPAGDDEEVTEQGDNRRQAAPQPAPSESLQKKAPMQQLNRKPNSRVSSTGGTMHWALASDDAWAVRLVRRWMRCSARGSDIRLLLVVCERHGVLLPCYRHISFPDVFSVLYAPPVAR